MLDAISHDACDEPTPLVTVMVDLDDLNVRADDRGGALRPLVRQPGLRRMVAGVWAGGRAA